MAQEGDRRFRCYSCGEVFLSGERGARLRCTKCDAYLMTYRARLAYIAESEVMRELSQGPSTDVSRGSISAGREFIEKLGINTSKGGGRYGKWTSVYYLIGDERSAIRLFIEENEDNVRRAFEGEGVNNIFKSHWPEHMWRMLEEQWYLGGHS